MFKNKLVLLHTALSLFFTQSIFWLVFVNIDRLPPEIPLWYLQPWGTSQLASVGYIWLFPGLAITILAVNLIFTAITYRRQPFLVSVVMSASSIASGSILITTARLLSSLLGWI